MASTCDMIGRKLRSINYAFSSPLQIAQFKPMFTGKFLEVDFEESTFTVFGNFTFFKR
jgi:hypothetical protein